LGKSFKVAIIAALEREVSPLVRDWQFCRTEYLGRRFKFYEKDGTVLVCAGIGAEAARRVTEAVISLYQPNCVISAGFAGGLDPRFVVGQVLTPRYVIDANDGSRTDLGFGEGTLVSFGSVANGEQKARLSEAYGAQAVDMEAAAVARSAEIHGVRFLACKAISDTLDSPMPPIEQFVQPNGRLRTLGFVAHVAVRPWLWTRVMKLARDAKIASDKLCEALSENIHAGISDDRLHALTGQNTH